MTKRPSIRPLAPEELFHLTRNGLEEISDDTLNARLDAVEAETLRLLSQSAGAEEIPEPPMFAKSARPAQ